MNSEFRFIELVSNGASNRGRIVELPSGVDWPDYYGKPAPTDAYCSIYRFDAGLAEHVRRTGGVRGYRGACKAAVLHFDFDGAGALEDVRRFIENICNDRLGIFIDNIQAFFSGNKGFHVLLQHPDIDAMPPGENVPEKIKKLAVKLAGRFSTLDKMVYDKTRIFRVPNSRHGASNLFKIPLLAAELWTLDMAGIRRLAMKQRSMQDATEQWIVEYRKAA